MIGTGKSANTVYDSQAWLVTFGDLLTLMLCFFVSIIALSPINPAVSERASLGSGATEILGSAISSKSASLGDPGITIAKTSVVVQPRRQRLIEFVSDDFVDEATGLGAVPKETLKNQLVMADYRIALVSVETCDGPAGQSEWYLSISRALLLERQLFDAGLGPELQRYQVLGVDCQALNAEEAGRAVVARITVDFEKVSNG